jgi:hypothetical protein
VRKPLTVAGAVAGLAAVPLTVVLIVLPGQASRALDVYVLFLGAVLLFALARMTAATEPQPPTPPLRPKTEGDRRLPELKRIEREVVLATGSEFDQHLRIKPLVRDVGEHRLWTRRGIDLEANPEKARRLLGSDVWELVKPGAPDPNSRYLRGLDLASLTRALDEIENL